MYNLCKVIYFTLLRKARRFFVAKNMEMALLFDFYGDMLTDKQRDMVGLYYDADLSLSEIAENAGITRQGVRDAIKRAEAQLLEMEDRLGLARRFRDMQADLAEISVAAAEIQEINLHTGVSREIELRVDKIRSMAARLAAD